MPIEVKLKLSLNGVNTLIRALRKLENDPQETPQDRSRCLRMIQSIIKQHEGNGTNIDD